MTSEADLCQGFRNRPKSKTAVLRPRDELELSIVCAREPSQGVWPYKMREENLPDSKSSPPRVRHTNSLTPSRAPSNRADAMGCSFALMDSSIDLTLQMLRAWSERCGKVRIPSPNGSQRARQIGADVVTLRIGVESASICQDWQA